MSSDSSERDVGSRPAPNSSAVVTCDALPAVGHDVSAARSDEANPTLVDPVRRVDPSIPASLGRFEIDSMLGSGGMGVVYLARDPLEPADSQGVALKTLRSPEPVALMRFKSEFRYTASLAHPNLIKLYELGVAGSTWFFTMERVHGRDLEEHLRQHSPSSAPCVDTLREVFAQLVDGLAALHNYGVRHLDLKPSNVMVTDSGRVVLLDFGLAAVSGKETRGAGGHRIVGTPLYMSPEQARGAPTDERADVYALGAMIYEALVGRRPFETPGISALTLIMRKCSEPAPHPKADIDVPEACRALADLCHACLAPDAADRPTLDEVMGVLRPESGETRISLAPRAVPLVGRSDELERVLAAFHQRDVARPTVLHVRGLSGVGKSRLLQEAVSRLSDVATVFHAKCHEFEAIPFKGLDDIVDQAALALRRRDEAERQELATPAVTHAARMFPAIFGAFPMLPDVGHETKGVDAREWAYAGLASLLAALHARKPLCVVLDDAQWGDAGAGRILASFLSPPISLPFFLVLGYRSDEAAESALLSQLEPLGGRGFHDEAGLDLEPLPIEAALELARRCSGDGEAGAELMQEIAEDARGNPFLIEQLALHGARTRTRVSVKSVVRARYEELSDQARSLLRTVSVAGQPLPQHLLLKAASVSDVRATVSTLAAKSLLRVDGAGADAKIVAYHDRIREGVLQALEPAERTYCHAALARELLDEPGAKPQLIASHLHGAGEGRHAAQYALKAAEEAMRGLAYQAAADSYRDAIEWSRGELPDLHQVRRAQADACHRAGRCDEAGESYLRAALSAPSPRDKMELERLAAEAFLAAGAVKEAFVVLRPLFAKAGVPFPKDAAAAVRGLAVAIAKVRLRVRGKELPRREGVDEDALFKSALCWSVGKGLSNIAPVEGAVTVLRSLLYGLDSGSPEAAARGLLFIGSGFTPFMGRRPDDFMALAQAIADETGSAVLQGLLHTAWCQRGLLVGDWDDAVRHGDDAVSILSAAPEPTAWGIAVARTTITACLEYRGHLREMRSRSEEFLRETANSGEQITFVMVTSALGYTLAAANDLVGLRRAIDDMRRTMASWTVEFGLWDFYRLRLEVLERLLGSEPAGALEIIDAAMPGIKAANLLRVPVVLPAILHVRVAAEMAALASAHPAQRAGLLKRARKSVAELERVSRPDGPALAKVVRASLLGLSGDHAGATATLRSAHQACEHAQLGAMSLMCQRLLALRAGDSDTAREVEQRLAESGITNPELWGRYLTPGG